MKDTYEYRLAERVVLKGERLSPEEVNRLANAYMDLSNDYEMLRTREAVSRIKLKERIIAAVEEA